jgi:hypothetical protein
LRVQHRALAAAALGGALAALGEAAGRQVAAAQVGQVAGHRLQRGERAVAAPGVELISRAV